MAYFVDIIDINRSIDNQSFDFFGLMLKFSHKQGHVLLIDLVDVFPQSYDLAPQFTGERDGIVNLGNLVLFAVFFWYFAVVDHIGFDRVYQMKQKHAISERFVLEVFDSEFFRNSFVGPTDQLFLVDFSYTFFPVQFAQLPDNTESQCDISVDNVHASDSD